MATINAIGVHSLCFIVDHCHKKYLYTNQKHCSFYEALLAMYEGALKNVH